MMDGIETTRRLKVMNPELGIVALTGLEDQRAVRDMLVAGASGYVLKDSDGDEILNAVREAAAGGGIISPQLTPTVIDELTEALERERRRTRQLEIAQEALLGARGQPPRARVPPGSRAPHAGHRDPRHGADARGRHRAGGGPRGAPGTTGQRAPTTSPGSSSASKPAVEAGLTEWADVTDVAREVAAANDRIRVEAPDAAGHGQPEPPGRLPDPGGAGRERPGVLDRGPSTVLIRVDLEDGSPVIRVIDEGPGIDAKSLPRIFAPLEQGETLNSRTHQGMGLGLAIARMSARAMDGDVILEATGPGGSTFTWHVGGQPVDRIAHLKRRMCTFSNSPAAMKFASIAVPP